MCVCGLHPYAAASPALVGSAGEREDPLTKLVPVSRDLPAVRWSPTQAME